MLDRLTFRDSVLIAAPPEDVWLFVEDPELVREWNPKLSGVEPVSHGPRRAGYRYEATYRFRGEDRIVHAEIEEYQPPSKLVIAMRGGKLPPEGLIREAYGLFEHRRGTRLRQTITVLRSGIPWYFRWLIRLISRFGTMQGKAPLERLRELVEDAG